MNKSSVERGLYTSLHIKTYNDELQKHPNTAVPERFAKPNKADVAETRPDSCYSKLNADGLVEEEAIVEPNDVIIGKITSSILKDESGRRYKDASTAIKGNFGGVVDKVLSGVKNQDGYDMAKIKIRRIRKPEMGDKFSSRHGQKGVIGILEPVENMPFTKDGLVPDVIMNPHAYPSRMTIGQFLEAYMSKICAYQGIQGDGTAHEPVNFENLVEAMEKIGFSKSGRETLYCGKSGRKIESEIMIAPVFYQRLKHMVGDKIHTRARGPQQLLTHQPVEGRSRDGGLRLGTMEKDCLLSHGVSSMLKERMMECSDANVFHICDYCGLIAAKIKEEVNIYHCKACKNYKDITPIVMPYAAKLLQHQLAGMHIAMRIETENSK
jgi:DNA-directed RNA polymerase II subunit RPB2